MAKNKIPPTANPRSRLIGSMAIIISGIGFGSLGILGKHLYSAGITSGELLAVRFSLATLALGLWLAVTGKINELRLSARVISWCAGLGICGYALFSSCFFAALSGISASLTVLLLYTYPIFVTLGEFFFLKRALSHAVGICLPVVFIGTTLLVGTQFSTGETNAYIGLGLAAAAFYALYILISSRVLVGVPATSACFYIMGFAGLTLSCIYLRSPERLATIFNEATLLPWIGVVTLGTLAPMSLFLAGLKRISAAEASMLSTAKPVTGVLLAYALLGESLTPLQLLGGAMVLVVMIVLSRPRP